MWKKKDFYRTVHTYCFHMNYENRQQPSAANKMYMINSSSSSVSTFIKTKALAVCCRILLC